MRPDQGLIHVYWGNGKGKTTAALGLALRAGGWGRRVVVVQFLKGRDCGELHALSRLDNILVLRGKSSDSFVRQMSETEKQAAWQAHAANLQQALSRVARGCCDLLILDEALDACDLGLLDEAALRDLVEGKPQHLELVLTGRRPAPWLLAAADYATEMVKHKHPYDQGIGAREGIEF